MRVLLILAPRSTESSVFLDGENVSRFVTGVEVVAHVGEPTEVRLQLLPTSIEIEGEPEVLRRL